MRWNHNIISHLCELYNKKCFSFDEKISIKNEGAYAKFKFMVTGWFDNDILLRLPSLLLFFENGETKTHVF